MPSDQKFSARFARAKSPFKNPESAPCEGEKPCPPQTQPIVFLLDKDYKSNKCSANAVFNFQLKATPHFSTMVYIDLLFNIIVFLITYYVFSLLTLSTKNTISTLPSTYLCHASVGRASQTSVLNAHYICYKQLGRSRSPKICYIQLVILLATGASLT